MLITYDCWNIKLRNTLHRRSEREISLNKVKSCNSLLCIPLSCICSYQNSVVRYIFLILETSHLDILYLCEQGCEDSWFFFFRSQKGSASKKFWETLHWNKKERINLQKFVIPFRFRKLSNWNKNYTFTFKEFEVIISLTL